MEKTNLLEFTLPAMTEWFAAQGEKPFRARQVFQWIHQRGVADFDAMTDLAKSLREKLRQSAEVKALGFDDVFLRTWDYYFSYCEAGFSTRTLGDLQLVLTRPNNRRLPAPPAAA